MGKRKTAQRGPAVKKEPESKRRWIVVHAATGKPLLGWHTVEGVKSREKAQRLSDSYLTPTRLMLLHEWRGDPDPDAEVEEE